MEDFSVQVSKWVEKVQGQEDEFIASISGKLIQSLIKETPFDTGRTRGNWRARLNRPPRKDIKREDKTGAIAMRAAYKVLGRVKGGDSVYLVNRWYVAAIINKNPHGWKPVRMVDKTIDKVERFAEESIRKVRG